MKTTIPSDEDAPAAVRVRDLAADQHQRRERQRVAGDDPLELGEVGAEIALDRRQRDVHDGVVEHDHEEAERDRGERQPLAVLLCEDPSPHAPQTLASAWRLTSRGHPSAKQLEAANVARLARALGCDGYDELHRVSIDEPDRFWRAVVDDLGIPLARDWDEVLDDSRGDRVDDVVRRRAAERRRGVRPPLGARDARSGGGGVGARGRRATLAHVGGALARGAPARGGACAELGDRRGRRGRDVPADGARGRDRLARVRARRSDPGARSSRASPAPPSPRGSPTPARRSCSRRTRRTGAAGSSR